MTPRISIPKPCHEDWNSMSAREQGRHCELCCKTVVDFSSRSSEEITDYLKTNSSRRVCGRFRKDQLTPHTITKPVNRYRLFFAALIFVFGGALFTSCNPMHQEEVMGKIAVVDTTTTMRPDSVLKHMKQPDTTAKTGMKKSCTPVVEPNIYEVGEVMYFPEDSIHN